MNNNNKSLSPISYKETQAKNPKNKNKKINKTD